MKNYVVIEHAAHFKVWNQASNLLHGQTGVVYWMLTVQELD